MNMAQTDRQPFLWVIAPLTDLFRSVLMPRKV